MVSTNDRFSVTDTSPADACVRDRSSQSSLGLTSSGKGYASSQLFYPWRPGDSESSLGTETTANDNGVAHLFQAVMALLPLLPRVAQCMLLVDICTRNAYLPNG